MCCFDSDSSNRNMFSLPLLTWAFYGKIVHDKKDIQEHALTNEMKASRSSEYHLWYYIGPTAPKITHGSTRTIWLLQYLFHLFLIFLLSFVHVIFVFTLLCILGFCCEKVCSEYLMYRLDFAPCNCLQKFLVYFILIPPKRTLGR